MCQAAVDQFPLATETAQEIDVLQFLIEARHSWLVRCEGIEHKKLQQHA